MNRNMNVLVVDDFATMRRIIRGALKTIGFNNIYEAADGKGALDVLTKEDINLVMSDWIMPNMNGLELLKTIRADDKLKNIPFIMVTAEGQKKNVMDALESGVNSYIVKPFTPEVLLGKLKKVFKEA
jgi:two-component system chemotaxis response regulator CheY